MIFWIVCFAIVTILSLYQFLYTISPVPRSPLKSELQYYTQNKKRNFKSLTDPPTCKLTVVVPAFNEVERLPKMLLEAIEYLQKQDLEYEIIVVDDGSIDETSELANSIGKQHEIDLKVMTLAQNRGKGGAVIQGMKAASGEYILFVDADGATTFSDLSKLMDSIKVGGVAIGSRAHMVNTEAVVKRSVIRNILMKCFHLAVYLLGIQSIQDTQCGFKLFTREAAQRIVPNMHIEGWIFDIEMLILADKLGISVTEVSVQWQEIAGTKMNLITASVEMLLQLLLIRLNYLLGVWDAKTQ